MSKFHNTVLNPKSVRAKSNGHLQFEGLQAPIADPDILFKDIDVLSLDVFDTILVRRCTQPQDVFSWVEERTGQSGFREDRIAAEKATRQAHKKRGSEVTIEEIYEVLSTRRDLAEDAIEEELKAEEAFLFQSRIAADLIAAARLRGIRVIAVSDMYLQAHQVDRLLRSSDVKVDAVYTSADFRNRDMGKYNGTIFEHVAIQEATAPSRIMHVGDNRSSDVIQARAAGWNAFLISQMHDLLPDLRPALRAVHAAAKTPAGRIIAGQMTHAALKDQINVNSMAGFGYCYGGPLLFGTVQFLINQAEARDICHFALLERDGNIVKEALDRLEPFLGPYPFSYRLVPSSRRMSIFPQLLTRGFGAIESFFVDLPDEIFPATFFDVLGLPSPPDTEQDNTLRTASDQFEIFKTSLYSQAQQEKAGLALVLSDELEIDRQGKSVAWFDVGWGLTSANALNTQLNVNWPCLCIGSHGESSEEIPQAGYLFERGVPMATSDKLMRAPEIIELIFSATCPQVLFAVPEQDGTWTEKRAHEAEPELVRNLYVSQIWVGVFAFIDDIAPVADGLSLSEVQQTNTLLFLDLVEKPSLWASELLGTVPHSRTAGHLLWKTIDEYWKRPSTVDNTGTLPPIVMKMADHVSYNVLIFLARKKNLFSDRRRARFMRSAKKRAIRIAR